MNFLQNVQRGLSSNSPPPKQNIAHNKSLKQSLSLTFLLDQSMDIHQNPKCKPQTDKVKQNQFKVNQINQHSFQVNAISPESGDIQSLRKCIAPESSKTKLTANQLRNKLKFNTANQEARQRVEAKLNIVYDQLTTMRNIIETSKRQKMQILKKQSSPRSKFLINKEFYLRK